MNGKPQILEELGAELEQAARTKLTGSAERRSIPRSAVEAIPIVIAIAVVVAVVVVALVVLRPAHHAPAAGSGAHGARGKILDRNGDVLVETQPRTYIAVNDSRLPRGQLARRSELRRVAYALSGAGLTLGASLSPQQARFSAFYIGLHRRRFPELELEHAFTRRYPLHTTAGQLLGTVGPITRSELGDPHFRGTAQTSIVGQSGLEYAYDSVLRSGDTLKLTLDPGLQQVGTTALKNATQLNFPASGGAFVAMNPVDGSIYAMGSLPSFEPTIDRAIQSGGPVGSTIAPITAMAALESGAWSVGTTYDDTGQFCLDGQCRRNPGGAVHGVLDLVNALRVSDDVFFYNLGALTNADATTHPDGGALQQWASAFGLGRSTGIDLSGEVPGSLPTPSWRNHLNQLEAQCDAATGPFQGRPKHSPGGCGIADGTNRPWSVGDNVNLAVGQGDVQVTPLQLATAYSAIANGGTVVRPHLGTAVTQPDGSIVQRVAPAPLRHLRIKPQYLDAIRNGLRAAASRPSGTSADVFAHFPEPVFGQVGSAQYPGRRDSAWYAGFVPPSATSKPIVVVVTVQQGGFGDRSAAPAARQILSQWFLGRPGVWTPGGGRSL